MINPVYQKQAEKLDKQIEAKLKLARKTRDNKYINEANDLVDKRNAIIGLVDPAFGPSGHYGYFL